MEEIKISIIVPIYNAERFLPQCIESLLTQQFNASEYEVILINDGSKDKSGDIARKYSSMHSNIKYLEQENQGQAVARNYGIQVAKGKYLMFVDSDDYLISNTLKLVYDEAEENNVDIIISSLKVYRADGSFIISNDYKHFGINVSGCEAIINGLNIGSSCARLYRKSFFQVYNLNFTSGMKHEDVFLNLSAYVYARIIRSVDIVTYVYRWNEGSTDRSDNEDSLVRGLLSDVEIAKKEVYYAKSTEVDEKLSIRLSQMSCSLVVGIFYSFFTVNRKLSIRKKQLVIKKMMEYRLLPIKGTSCSWKSTLMAKIINISGALLKPCI